MRQPKSSQRNYSQKSATKVICASCGNLTDKYKLTRINGTTIWTCKDC